MIHPTVRITALALLLSLVASGPASAQEAANTLKKIKEAGAITLGHRESSIPFSYYDDKQQVIGYSQDLMMLIVDAIKTETKQPNLKVHMMPVTPATRISLIQNGTIDIECGSTTNNLERQKQVAFSNNIFAYGIRLMARKDSKITDFSDLAGKNVVVTAATTADPLVRKKNEDSKLGMNVILAKDHGESFLTVESGRAAAFVMDEPLLYGEIAKAKRPGDWAVVGTPLQTEVYACMMRKDDPQFKKVVDTALAKAMKSGEAEKLYNKWFLSPIPPKGLNLNFPMSDVQKALFKAPNDRAFQ